MHDAKDPYYKGELDLKINGLSLKFEVPHDLFSTLEIDQGTRLLLKNLPANDATDILDMGCGYGALGLPVAMRYPHAKVEMVDRDLLAVKWTDRNARKNKLSNVSVYGSLGFRDLKNHGQAFDWILCNVPARIGDAFMEDLFTQSQVHLRNGGELRLVVIRALEPLLERLCALYAGAKKICDGPRHIVFAYQPVSSPTALMQKSFLELYARDQIKSAGHVLDRPFDLGGDDPKRLASGIPLLAEHLPTREIKNILCFRQSYGVLARLCFERWPHAKIVIAERDLLASAFAQHNLQKPVEMRERAELSEALLPSDSFDLIVGELSSSAGQRVAEVELAIIQKTLAKDGEALLLCPAKLGRALGHPSVAANADYCLLRFHA